MWTGSLDRGVDLSLAGVTRSLAGAGTPRRSPLEGTPVRASAVLAPLYEHDDETIVILTRRAQTLRTHRGEVSFPGGGAEPGDADLWATALARVARGDRARSRRSVDPHRRARPPRRRSRAGPTSSRSSACCPAAPTWWPNPAEVELVRARPLRELLTDGVYHEERWGLPPLDHPVTSSSVVGDTIWGATAAMLVNLLTIIAAA